MAVQPENYGDEGDEKVDPEVEMHRHAPTKQGGTAARQVLVVILHKG